MLKIGAIFLLSHRLLQALKPVSEGIHAHKGMRAFASVTLGPYRWKTEQSPIWLSSGPCSGLSKLIIIIHSCDQYLTASWQSVLAQHTTSSVFTGKSHIKIKGGKEKVKKSKKIVVLVTTHIIPSISLLLTSCLQQYVEHWIDSNRVFCFCNCRE